MPYLTPAEAIVELADAVSFWRINLADARQVIDAAVECLVADVDTPMLRELAGASSAGSRFDLDPMIDQAFEELGKQDLLATSPDCGAMAVMIRRFKRGEVSARELCRWAHRAIGHSGDPDCQAFVVLDDAYDIVDYSDEDEESLGRHTAEAAEAFLARRT